MTAPLYCVRSNNRGTYDAPDWHPWVEEWEEIGPAGEGRVWARQPSTGHCVQVDLGVFDGWGRTRLEALHGALACLQPDDAPLYASRLQSLFEEEARRA